MGDWDGTRLFNSLKQRGNNDRHINVANLFMPPLQTVLRSGAPGSVHFTLHDDQHSFRVAEMSATLLSDRLDRLSSTEVLLLLFASYGHDVGMSPGRGRVRSLHDYLITGDSGSLNQQEILDFQSWLDASREGLTPPISDTKLTRDNLYVVDDALAYYTRSKHNDWSEEYLRTSLTDGHGTLYTGWVDDLVSLCRSHHEGLAQLRQSRFDAKIVGSPAEALNLRYLAAILRLADVLEFDPERTPEVVLRQRDIDAKSRIFWYKDKSISFVVDPSTSQLIFSAQTPSAAIHKAVLETADWVDSELATCTALAHENAYERGVITENARTIYRWPWPSRLTRAIRELPGRFEYIDGAFKPDAKRVLGLLSGTALYGSPTVAVRELVQNAIDAVREQMAYARLSWADSCDADAVAALMRLHRVTLSLSLDGDDVWLRCVDNGSGMTKEIIEKYLLVSGASARGAIRRLERDAISKGFMFERTGRFGIGVLSYFMIADEISLSTRRSQEAGDTEGISWRFTTSGLYDFGELSKESGASHGTNVGLRIKPEVYSSDPAAWAESIRRYISNVIRRSPCIINVKSDIGLGFDEVITPGWTVRLGDIVSDAINNNFSTPPKKARLQSAAEKGKAERSAAVIKRKREAAYRAYKEVISEEIVLTGTVTGRMRTHLPIFALPGGDSVFFFEVDDNDQMRMVQRPSGTLLEPMSVDSMHGILVKSYSRGDSGCFTEMDYGDTRSIAVSRKGFVDNINDGGEHRERSTSSLWTRFLLESLGSKYHTFNVLGSPLPPSLQVPMLSNDVTWCVVEGRNAKAKWGPLNFPVLSVDRISFMQDYRYRFSAADGIGSEAVSFSGNGRKRPIRLHNAYSGGKLLVYGLSTLSYGVVAIRWDDRSEMLPLTEKLSSLCTSFPDEWKNVFIVIASDRLILNSGHKLSLSLANLDSIAIDISDVDEVAKNIAIAMANSGSALQFVISALSYGMEKWQAIAENFKSEMLQILSLCGIMNVGDAIAIDLRDVRTEGFSNFDLLETVQTGEKAKRGLPDVGASSQLKRTEG